MRVEDRYPTLKDMADDLRSAMQGRAVSAYHPPIWRLVLVRRNHPLFWMVVGFVFVSASLAGVLVLGLFSLEWLIGAS